MNMLKNKAAGIAAAVALAATGTVLLVTFVNGAEDRALEGERLTDVWVVESTIPEGTKAEAVAGMVRTERVPVKVRATGAVSSLDVLAGKVAAVDLLPGEQIVSSRFVSPGVAAALSVPPGFLRVTVAMESVRAMGGMVRPGDTVAVVVSLDGDAPSTHIILHKVKVTDVRNEKGAAVKAADGNETALTGSVAVTLALDAPSVERVVYAAEYGRLWLSAEPIEAIETGTRIQTRGSVNG